MGKGLVRKVSSQTFPHINTPTFSTPVILRTHLPMMMEQTKCSETLEYEIQAPGNYAEESIQQMSISLAASILRHARVHTMIWLWWKKKIHRISTVVHTCKLDTLAQI